MHGGTPFIDDVELRAEGVVRIYDIFFDYDVLLSTDRFVREVSARPVFQHPMSTAEYHYLLGGYVAEREKALGLSRKSVLSVVLMRSEEHTSELQSPDLLLCPLLLEK